MPSLATLPSEVLTAVIEQLVAMSYSYDKQAFGPTLRALSLVNRRLASASEPFRYRDYEFVLEKEEGRLEQHLSRASSMAHIHFLAVPVYYSPGMTVGPEEAREIAETYDALLAKVIGLAVAVKEITLVFDALLFQGSRKWDPEDPSRKLLEKTVQACINHTQVRSLRCKFVCNLSAGEQACKIIKAWSTLERVEVITDTYGLRDGVAIDTARHLLQAACARDELRELLLTPITWMNAPFSLDPVRDPLALMPCVMQNLRKLHIKYEVSRQITGWSHLVAQILRANPHLHEIHTPICLLYLAMEEGEDRLDLPQLEILRIDTASYGQLGFMMTLDEFVAHLHGRSNLLASGSMLSSLCLLNYRSLDLAETLVVRPPGSSLRLLSVEGIVGRHRSRHDLESRKESLTARCAELQLDLRLKLVHMEAGHGRPAMRKPVGSSDPNATS